MSKSHLFTHIRLHTRELKASDVLQSRRKAFLISSENCENWVNNVSLHFRQKEGTFGVWSIDEDEYSCSVVSYRDAQRKGP